ncbi:MAG: SAM-dependent methyltransferase [archaeon]
MNIVEFGSLLIFLFLFWFFYSRFFGAEFYPTTERKMRKMLEFANLKRKDAAYDLGCGDGRLVISAARKCRKSVGIEIDPLRCLVSFLKVQILRLRNARIIFGDIFRQDFGDADVVFLFLRQKANDNLQSKLANLKKGTRIVSHFWVFKGWKPVRHDKKLNIYLYVIGKSNKRNV